LDALFEVVHSLLNLVRVAFTRVSQMTGGFQELRRVCVGILKYKPNKHEFVN